MPLYNRVSSAMAHFEARLTDIDFTGHRYVLWKMVDCYYILRTIPRDGYRDFFELALQWLACIHLAVL